MWYPGLEWNGPGIPTPDGRETGFSGNGAEPAARFAVLLNARFFTPDYLLNPADAQSPAPPPDPDGEVEYQYIQPSNFSYALLALPGSENERAEWTETLNPAAVVLGDRAIGTGPGDVSSAWTRRGTGVWRGHIGRNDNSVEFVDSAVVSDTRYGDGAVNPRDDLFADDHAADDALLVHEDATTAYSAD